MDLDSLSSLCILQDLQVGGGGLYQGARGSKQTTSLKFHAFAEEILSSLKFPALRAKERSGGGRGAGVGGWRGAEANGCRES